MLRNGLGDGNGRAYSAHAGTPREASAYLVTLWTARKRPLFGVVEKQGVRLSRAGSIVATCVEQTPVHYPSLRVHAFVVMPDHVHLVLGVIPTARRPTNASPREQLARALRSLKAIAARVIRANGIDVGARVWQAGFHDAALSGRAALAAALRYVREHPLRWNEPPRLRPGAEPRLGDTSTGGANAQRASIIDSKVRTPAPVPPMPQKGWGLS